jgi:hypothetical protein
LNTHNVATGTLSPLSLTTTPKGLLFLAPEGFRLIDFNAAVSPPIGQSGQGISVPFIYAYVPSRVIASANADVVRVSTQNSFATGNPQQEWWFDQARGIWHGPHTFPASLMQPWRSTFIMTPIGVGGSLWRSDIFQDLNSSFVENGAQMGYQWQTSLLPDAEQMAEFAMIETTINMALSLAQPLCTVTALNEQGFAYDQVSINAAGKPTRWGQFNWGGASWLGDSNNLYPRAMPWHQPIVFRRLALSAVGLSSPAVQIGDMFMRYEMLPYLQQEQAIGSIQTAQVGPQSDAEPMGVP